MPVLGCGAEMEKLMKVSEQDISTIEDTIKERLDMGLSQAVAQRQAVDEALAQLADHRSEVMAAVLDQLKMTKEEFGQVHLERLVPSQVLTPEIIREAKAAIAKYKKPESKVDPLTPEQRKEATEKLAPMFEAAERNKPAFDKALEDIADELGTWAKMPGLKKAERAGTKLMLEMGGDAGLMKDLLRGTIAVRNLDEAKEAIRLIGEKYKFDRIKNRFGDGVVGPDGEVEFKAMATGYRDILTNVVLEDGTVAEIQISTPELLAAKNLGHEVYAFEREMPNGVGKADMVGLQKRLYGQVAKGDGLKPVDSQRLASADRILSKSSRVVSPALLRTSEGLRDLSPSGNAAYATDSSASDTIGTSSQSKNLAPLGNEDRSNITTTSEPILPEDGVFANKAAAEAAGFDSSTLWLHGTTRDFKGFKVGKGGVNELGPGVYLTRSGTYADAWSGGGRVEGGRTIPAYIKKGDLFDKSQKVDYLALAQRLKERNPVTENERAAKAIRESKSVMEWTPGESKIVNDASMDLWRSWLLESDKDLADQIKRGELNTWLDRAGYIGAVNENSQVPDQVVVFDPKNIRSPWAKFNPKKADSNNLLFANKSQSKWRDDLGNWQFAPGKMLFDLIGDKTLPLLDRVYLTTASKETRQALRQMKLDVQKAKETASEIAHEVNKLSAEERKMISDIVEKELKAGVTPTAAAVQHAAMMNEAFENQTNELVRLGMLTKEAADKWRGKYLPRYYEKHTDSSETLQVLSRSPKAAKGIGGKHLKGRGLTVTVSKNDIAEWEAEGWEVRDKNFDPTVHKNVTMWRDFTREEREKMGEIRDAGFRFVMGYMATQKDIALGRMYEGISQNEDMSSREASELHPMQVPDTTVAGTGAKKYGKLGGMYVSREMWSQLSAQQEMESDAFRLYKKALSLWKEGKTVLNPVSHMNNFVSNMTMAHLAGVSYYDAHKYAGTIKDLATKADMVKEANEAGLWLGTMSQEELGKMLPLELQTLLNKQDSKTVHGMKVAYTVLTWGLRRPMGVAYEFGDKFFKYMIYKEARAKGMSPQDAVDYAGKYIFNYDDLPATARKIRDFGMPFFSYTYKAVPALAETALTHPHRMLAPAALLSMAGMAAYAIAAGGDDDDWMDSIKKYLTDESYRKAADDMRESEYKLLPEWMKGRTALGSPKTMRLGTDQETQNPVFMDTSRFIPGGDLFDLTGNSGGMPFVQPFTPNNPLLTTFAAMFVNRDPFSGKDIVNKNSDSDTEAGAKRAKWLWKMAAPAIAVNQSHWDRAVQAVANQMPEGEVPGLPDILGGNLTGVGSDGLPVQPKYAAMNTVGIKARPQDLAFSEAMQNITRKKTLAELEAELRRARFQNQKGQLKDRQFDKIRESVQEKKDRVLEGMTVDGNSKD